LVKKNKEGMSMGDAIAILKQEIRDKCSAYADRALAEILPLVEEKFKPTNKPSAQRCPNCNTDYDVGIFNVCENCGHQWS